MQWKSGYLGRMDAIIEPGRIGKLDLEHRWVLYQLVKGDASFVYDEL